MSQVILNDQMEEIKKIVKKNTSVNIDYYANSFLQRRIYSRMCITEIESLSKYISFLKDDPLETLEFNASLSINVTEFFRDQKVWDVFEQKVIPEVIKKVDNSEKIHIWSAGCATGNEPYSLAMMLSNALENSTKQFSIVANDMSPTLVAIAKTGKYEYDKLKKISNLLFSKFLEKIDDDLYKINDDIKKSISFQVDTVHSINLNPVDIIVCRNLLIYYGDAAKDLLFKKFYKTLKNDGFLILGMFENIPHCMDKYFKPVDVEKKIYQKIGENFTYK